jgi:hypothetical protein
MVEAIRGGHLTQLRHCVRLIRRYFTQLGDCWQLGDLLAGAHY